MARAGVGASAGLGRRQTMTSGVAPTQGGKRGNVVERAMSGLGGAARVRCGRAADVGAMQAASGPAVSGAADDGSGNGGFAARGKRTNIWICGVGK
jgi:hypothetical protein